MTGGIYAIAHRSTGKLYVGRSVNIRKRWKTHIKRLHERSHHSPYLQNSWNRYGAGAFIFLVLEPLGDATAQDYNDREQFWMNLLLPEYNVLQFAGSLKGRIVSLQTKQRMSQAQKGRTISPEHRLKISESLKQLLKKEQVTSRLCLDCRAMLPIDRFTSYRRKSEPGVLRYVSRCKACRAKAKRSLK